MSNDGTPAFPQPIQIKMRGAEALRELSGMTLRQWYAGMALQGMMKCAYDTQHESNAIAKIAFHHADAMIEFEEKESEKVLNG